ncbi:hypothetical protein NQZ68_008470 [Dissostichus eleginoides]|nr:hypothetical protein NQZ68_008470 [Dissostichus eleginoides]
MALAHCERCNQDQMASPDKTKYTTCALWSTPINSTGLFSFLFQQLGRDDPTVPTKTHRLAPCAEGGGIATRERFSLRKFFPSKRGFMVDSDFSQHESTLDSPG